MFTLLGAHVYTATKQGISAFSSWCEHEAHGSASYACHTGACIGIRRYSRRQLVIQQPGLKGDAIVSLIQRFFPSEAPTGVNLFRAPKPLSVRNPSNFVAENGFPVVKALLAPTGVTDLYIYILEVIYTLLRSFLRSKYHARLAKIWVPTIFSISQLNSFRV